MRGRERQTDRQSEAETDRQTQTETGKDRGTGTETESEGMSQKFEQSNFVNDGGRKLKVESNSIKYRHTKKKENLK